MKNSEWVQDKEDRVTALEQTLVAANLGTFVGTMEEYKDAVREAKLAWLKKWGFVYDHFHGVQYGATKADSVRKKTDYGILIDDNEKVRKGWTLGATIDPTKVDIIEALMSLLG